MDNPRHFLMFFLFNVAAGMCAMAVLCIYANPWGNYGRSRLGGLYNAHLAKSDYIETLDPSKLPEVVVVGSSDTMCYSEAHFNFASQQKFFNFGVFHPAVGDLLAIQKYLQNLEGSKLKVLFVGLDTWMFSPVSSRSDLLPEINRKILNVSALARFYPQYSSVLSYWLRFTDLFTEEQVLLSAALMQIRNVRTVPEPLNEHRTFQIDGSRIPPTAQEASRFNAIANSNDGLRLVAAALQYFDSPDLSEDSISTLRKMTRDAISTGIHVIFFLNPVHPKLYANLVSRASFKIKREKIMLAMSEIVNLDSKRIHMFDLSDTAVFDSSEPQFYDLLHPAGRTCERAMHFLLQKANLEFDK